MFLIIDCRVGSASQAPINLQGQDNKSQPGGHAGAKPAREQAFIGVFILVDTEALAGFAMPARASAFNSV